MELFLRTLVKLSLLGSALAVVLTVLRPLLRRWVSRKAAYYLWLLVLLRLCVPVGVDLPVPAAAAEPASVPAPPVMAQAVSDLPVYASGNEPETNDLPDIPEPSIQPDIPTDIPVQTEIAPSAKRQAEWLKNPYLWGALWWFGTLASIGWFVLGYLRVSGMIRRTAGAASPEALAILRELDPRGRVRMVESPAVNTPLLLGVLRPVIVLPFGVTDTARLRDILAHELTHVRRHDLLFKWFAAVVTSLHWFNPVMLLVRREIGRACELACDEAVVRGLDSQGRRHYGETLLAVASRAPGGLGPMAVTLCEEKKQLKERLACIAAYKKSGPMVLFLSLALAAVLGACAMVTGVALVTPDVPEPLPGEEQTSPEEPEDVTVYELDGGLTIAFPDDLADRLVVVPGPEGEPALWNDTILSVYERQSYEDVKADWDVEGGGYLFGIARYNQAQYEQHLSSENSGERPFATDGTSYYMHIFATDVRFYRSDPDSAASLQEAMEPWYQLDARVSGILHDFTVRNGLEACTFTDTDLIRQGFTYDSAHHYARYQNGSWEMTLLLSQPVFQGEFGIWCVERWADSNGNFYPVFPGKGEVTAGDYYLELQTQANAGERPDLLDPLRAAEAWLREYYADNFGVIPAINGDALTLLEGEPAGNVWGGIGNILEQAGTLEYIFYLDGKGLADQLMSFDEPVYYSERHITLASAADTSLRSGIWIKAEPQKIEGRVVRFTAGDGDTVLFLENDSMVCVRRNGSEEWFQAISPQWQSPYTAMYQICQDWASYKSGGAELRFTEDEITAAVEMVHQLFDGDAAGTLEFCDWDPVYALGRTKRYLRSGRGSVNGVAEENVFVVRVTFTTGGEDAVRQTALEADSTYDWDYILIRENKDAPWVIDDWGV